jgi:hypothetical protein
VRYLPIHLLAVLTCIASARAEDGEFRLRPYLWVAGFTGTLGAPTSSSGVTLPAGISERLDATFGDLGDNLRVTGGAMLFAEWRRGPWAVLADWTYARVESSAASPFPQLYHQIDGQIAGNILQASVAHRLWADDRTRVDGYAGVRYYDITVDFTLQPGVAPQAALHGNDDWLDGLVGLRVEHGFSEHWGLTLVGDVGSGGSDISWQAEAAIAYRLSWGSIQGGWRVLHADRTTSDFRLDATLSGPFLGVALVF